ncbi:MAG: patatin-like phospholipase family protein [Candidatus Hatepunaea meridiana]|nr:patatin-like phospholipase family protein [Candidatus Hatepunaea meridiana]
MPDRPRLVLALSGGGGRGLAHIGVLEALDEAGIKPDGITGVSIGALVGGLYAAGFSPAEISARLQVVNWSGVIIDKPERKSLLLARKEEQSRHLLTLRLSKSLAPVVPGALSPGQRLYVNLLDLTLDMPYRTGGNWSKLKIPLQILATDLQTGKGFIFDSDDLTPAFRSTLSMPLVFDPFIYDTLHLIDGGITSNIPVEAARVFTDDIVLAVDVTSPLRPPSPPIKPWHIVDQVTTILEKDVNTQSLNAADVVVTPNLGDIITVKPDQFHNVIKTGKKAMQDAMSELLRALRKPEISSDNNFISFDKIEFPNDKQSTIAQLEDWTKKGGTHISEIRNYIVQEYNSGIVREAYALYDSTTSTLIIRIRRTNRFNKVVFNGDSLITDDVLIKTFLSLYGKPLNFDSTSATLENVLKLHRQAGFPLATFSNVNFDTTSGVLSITINAGRLCNIQILGLEKVPADWLTREIPIKCGQIVTKRKILKGTANLYATGLFRNVYPVLTRNETVDTCWTLKISVTEHPAPPVRLGINYFGEHFTHQGERLTRGFIEFVYPSRLNYAARTIIFAAAGWRDAEYRITDMADKIFGLPLMYSLSFGYHKRRRVSYDTDHSYNSMYRETRWGGYLEAGGHALNWGLLKFTARWENHINNYSDRKEEYYLSAIGTRLAIDTHDREPFPHRGVHLKSAYETASSYLGSKKLFNKFWGEADVYFTPIHRHTLCFRLSGATADRTTPFDERFRTGGMSNFPGLHLDEIIGIIKINGGIEYRFDLLSRILADSYIGFRFDVAGGWDDPEAHISRQDWMHSSSIYFALDTIIGPLIIQWGHLLNEGPLPQQDILFLQIGNQF